MRMSGNGEGGQIFREDSQQVDSEPENNLDFSSSESDESDDCDNYPFPFEGEADHYFFKFGGEKDFVTSAMTLPTTNQMQAKSTNASVPRNLQLNGNNSDSEMRRVPEMSGKANPTSAKVANGPSSQSRKRGGASADKEHKRMKRLLRNRVSAQQARERKKAYLSELEMKSKELEQKNAELQERISTLERENYMLRQIVKNTTLKNAEVHQ